MMRRWFCLTAVLCTLAVAVLIGCETMFESAGGQSSGDVATDVTAGGLTNSGTSSSGGGYFADVGGDVVDVRPEEVEVEEEGEETASNFRAIQVDPAREDSAGPKFVLPYDMDNDGLVDLVTAWNQSQPVQLHLQRRDEDGKISFVSVNLGGTGPIALVGDLAVEDMDQDGWLDVVMAVKTTGYAPICPTPDGEEPYEVLAGADEGEVQILFSPGNQEQITNGDAWQEVRLDRSRFPGRRDKDIAEARAFPEWNSYTGIAAGELDGINGPDIVVNFNPATCEFYGDDPPYNRVVLYFNPGGANTRDPGTIPLSVTADAGPDQAVPVPDPDDPQPQGAEVSLWGGWSYSSIYSDVGYFWEQVAGPDVDLAGAYTSNPTFTAPITATALTFRLTVGLGDAVDFDYCTVVVGEPANLPPSVWADGEQTVLPDVDDPGATRIEMSAVGTDPENDALTYEWTQVAGPPVAVNGATSPLASFVPPEQGGELRFRVTVSDGTLFDSASTVVVTGVWGPIVLDGSLARTSDVLLSDVDLDGDNDIVYTFPDQITSNITWARNPLVPHDETGTGGAAAAQRAGMWQRRPVGHVDTDADVMALGDVDLDGFDDVLVRSTAGLIVQWFRHPGAADLEPIFPPPDAVPDRFNFPWQVYTMAEYVFRLPAGIAIGDLTGDGFNEVTIAAGGVVYWYDSAMAENIYDPWGENFVIDDTKANGTTDDPNDPDFIDAGTVLNALAIVDIDGDGYDDVIGTLDRRTLSGLNDDTLIWFRNTLGEQGEEDEPAE